MSHEDTPEGDELKKPFNIRGGQDYVRATSTSWYVTGTSMFHGDRMLILFLRATGTEYLDRSRLVTLLSEQHKHCYYF